MQSSVMRRTCAVIVATVLLGLAARAEATELVPEPPPPKAVTWTVQVDPLTTVLGIAHVLFERRVHQHFAVYLGPSLRLYDSPLTPDDEEGYRAYGVEAGVRWFRGTAPIGWWAGLRVTAARVTFEDASRAGGYISALGGYAWLVKKRLILSLALGVSYFDYNAGGRGPDGVLPGAHTGIGVAF